MKSYGRLLAGIACGLMVVATGGALAAAPEPWQLGMQAPATPVKEAVESLHNLILVIITAITLFVLALLVIVVVRFSAKRNPPPAPPATTRCWRSPGRSCRS